MITKFNIILCLVVNFGPLLCSSSNFTASLRLVRLAQLLDEEHGKGPKLTTKQGIMLSLVINSVGVFPHVFNAAKRWDRAEELYEEGVKRGHFPKG